MDTEPDRVTMTGPTSRPGALARPPYPLGEMPLGTAMKTTDERLVHAPTQLIFDIARQVELWPGYLSHYRRVYFRERTSDGGGLVEMAAWRPIGSLPGGWPTWWLSEMAVDYSRPAIRFRHVDGITRGMDVEWSFHARPEAPSCASSTPGTAHAGPSSASSPPSP
jgi:hypothetical protein